MKLSFRNYYRSIAMVFSMAMLFFSCKDNYRRVGEEAEKIVYPRGIAENFELTYSELPNPLENEVIESSKKISILRSPISYNFDNLVFPHRTFPKGLEVEFFDSDGNKSTIKADYGIRYTVTALIDLRGNVVIENQDGKKLETSQLYYDEDNEWIFTQKKFKFTNPQDGTIMDGEGMDFNKDLSFLNAQKTYGLMMIKEDSND
ncbi:MAG: LPS export ABC transporter periplasmic protein LptC [Maribacter sp.]|nr:LPS export ABC transporter periplasmic protein LptC [Maribacter sp.]